MKKLFLILLAVIAVSCSKDDNFDSNEASKELIGIWKRHNTDPEYKNDYYYEFREGFICYSYQTKKNSLEIEFSTMGRYSLRPNTIYITWSIQPDYTPSLRYKIVDDILYIGKTSYERADDLFYR